MIKENLMATSKMITKSNGKMRKQLITFDVSGMIYEEKKKLVKNHLIKVFGKIPEDVRFDSRKTKVSDDNPDGLRIFVKCGWIKRNRFYDYNGVFHIGTVIKAINKSIQGKTKLSILKPD